MERGWKTRVFLTESSVHGSDVFLWYEETFPPGSNHGPTDFVPDHLPCGVIFYAFFEGGIPPPGMGGEDTPGESFRVKHAFGSGAFAL